MCMGLSAPPQNTTFKPRPKEAALDGKSIDGRPCLVQHLPEVVQKQVEAVLGFDATCELGVHATVILHNTWSLRPVGRRASGWAAYHA